MKKENKLVLIITMIVALIATITTIGYALTFKADAPIAEQGSANALWSVTYWVVFVFAVLAILGVGIFFLVQMWKESKLFILILGITLVAFFVSYFLVSGTDIPRAAFEKAGANYDSSKWIGAACYTVYVLFAGVIGSVLYSEVSKRLK
ncbi:MAG: hypothetical protein KBT03_11660 [Bacteroidales bacterium]|nr:hypothetical protein [Candidatus Scybalousia scybalohippi]